MFQTGFLQDKLLPLPFLSGLFKIYLSSNSIWLQFTTSLWFTAAHRFLSVVNLLILRVTAHFGYMHPFSKSAALHFSLLNLFFVSLNYPCSSLRLRRCYDLKYLQCPWLHFTSCIIWSDLTLQMTSDPTENYFFQLLKYQLTMISAHFPSLFTALLGFPQELLYSFLNFFGKVTKIPDQVWDCLAVLQALHPSGELGGITAKGWQLKTIWVEQFLEIFFKVSSSKPSIPHLGSASQFSSLTYPALCCYFLQLS